MIKLKSLLIEEESQRILIPRNVEGREDKLKRIHWRRVLKYIKDGSRGSLVLYKTPLEFLPEGLIRVDGGLILSYSKIKKLPDTLKEIKDGLYLPETLIEYLPESLTYVGGYLDLSDSKIKKLPDNLKEINKSLLLTNTPIKYLPMNLSINEDLLLQNTPLSEKYTKDEIRKMVKHIGGNIYT
jgi:hypothetical protein